LLLFKKIVWLNNNLSQLRTKSAVKPLQFIHKNGADKYRYRE
jgi:hypothetical protein